jgi:hypothetical protein
VRHTFGDCRSSSIGIAAIIKKRGVQPRRWSHLEGVTARGEGCLKRLGSGVERASGTPKARCATSRTKGIEASASRGSAGRIQPAASTHKGVGSGQDPAKDAQRTDHDNPDRQDPAVRRLLHDGNESHDGKPPDGWIDNDVTLDKALTFG